MAKRPTPVTPKMTDVSESIQQTQTLKKSAIYIVGAIIVALAAYFGWTYFQQSGLRVDTVAADSYAVIEQTNAGLQQRIANGEDVPAEELQLLNTQIGDLVTAHGDTIYAWEALILQARNATDMGNLSEAQEALKQASKIDLGDAGLRSITQLRYAAALLADNKLDEAKKVVDISMPTAFQPTQQELLGDIYMAQQDIELAKRSYNNAWSMLAKRQEDRPILRLKLQNLGISPEPIAEPTQIVRQTSTVNEPAAEASAMSSEENADVAVDVSTADTQSSNVAITVEQDDSAAQ